MGRTAETRDDKGRPQGKSWETAAAKQVQDGETHRLEVISCSQDRHVQQSGAGRNTDRKYQDDIQLGKNASTRKQPKKQPVGEKSLETVIDEF